MVDLNGSTRYAAGVVAGFVSTGTFLAWLSALWLYSGLSQWCSLGNQFIGWFVAPIWLLRNIVDAIKRQPVTVSLDITYENEAGETVHLHRVDVKRKVPAPHWEMWPSWQLVGVGLSDGITYAVQFSTIYMWYCLFS